MTGELSRDELFDRVRDFLAGERGVDPDGVTEDTALEDLGLDSLTLTELGYVLFVSHGVALDDDVVLTARTLADVLDAVCGRQPDRSLEDM